MFSASFFTWFYMVTAIVFDIGNVLLRFDFNLAIQRVAPFCSVEPSEIHALLEPLKVDLERGRIGGDAFLREMASGIGFSGELGELRSAWQEIFSPIEHTHQLVAQWKGRLPLYLLSNTNDIHAEYFLREYPVFNSFDGAVFSHEAGVMKPDSGIYEHTVEKFGLKVETTLFIDDLLPNVSAAAGLGWLVHHYHEREHHALVARAQSLNLL
jgi:glucose-1-phosphatase